MKFIVRAASVAAAAVTIAATSVFAGPSLAGELDTTPLVPTYAAHAAANLSSSALVLNTVSVPALTAETTDFSTPLADHAVATVTAKDEAPEQGRPAKHRALADLVKDFAAADVPDDEHHCLAGAIYFESKGEPLSGQLAVAEVIRNRAASGKFASSLCGVVKQRGQFSFIRGGRFPAIAKTSAAWREAVAIAHIAQQELAESSAPKALFFHAKRVSPGWKGLKRVATVGNHVFYR